MEIRAHLVAEVLDPRARSIVVALYLHGDQYLGGTSSADEWPGTAVAPAPFELSRLTALITTDVTPAGTKIDLTVLGREVARALVL